VEAAIAHQLADYCLAHSTTLHSQHIWGKRNLVADALSWIHHWDDNQLTHFCLHTFPHQLPQDFQIYPIPDKISSWINLIVALSRSCRPQPNPPPINELEAGLDGLSTWGPSESDPIFFSTASRLLNNREWQEDTFSPSEMDPFLPPSPEEMLLETIRQGYWDGASKKPLGTWVRNSGVTIGRAPFTSTTTPTGSLLNLKLSSKHGPTSTPPPTRPSSCHCS
jgi:hypothetical protein